MVLLPFMQTKGMILRPLIGLKTIKIDPSVKAVAAEQDHFERFHNNRDLKTLVGL